MTGPDDEFEDFLKKRKPVFERPRDELFEPPAELDRVVLRQAREAIKADEPMKVFSAPRWSVPVALAATLVLAFTVIFQAGMPAKQAPRPEVTVQNVAEEVAVPTAADETAARRGADGRPQRRRGSREPGTRHGGRLDGCRRPRPVPPKSQPGVAMPIPGMAEIERLRNAGNAAARRRGIRGIQAPAACVRGSARSLSRRQRPGSGLSC